VEQQASQNTKFSEETWRYFQVRQWIERCFDVQLFQTSGDLIKITYRTELMGRDEIKKLFESFGYKVFFRSNDNLNFCLLVPRKKASAGARRKENITALVLFIITLITTTGAGFIFSYGMVQEGLAGSMWPGALSFSISLLLILGTHEMAHKAASWHYGIDSSPPYFIPFPSIIGTMGAVIKLRSPMPDRNAAVALGISGPLAGFLMAVPVFTIGVLMSKVVPAIDPELGMIFFGEAAITWVIQRVVGGVQDGYMLVPHPMVISAWVGFLVTGLNLIPMGQFDGGHIAHALLGDRNHRFLCWGLVGALMLMGVFFWSGWFIWGAIGAYITSRGYPRSMDDSKPLTVFSKVMAVVGFVLLALCFMPEPAEVYGDDVKSRPGSEEVFENNADEGENAGHFYSHEQAYKSETFSQPGRPCFEGKNDAEPRTEHACRDERGCGCVVQVPDGVGRGPEGWCSENKLREPCERCENNYDC